MFATRLGPIETGDGAVNLYVGFTEDGLARPVMAPDDAEGLEKLLQFSDGKRLRCDRSLARAGKPLGYSPATAPPLVVAARAALAFGLALDAPPLAPDVVAELLTASAAFLEAEPWRWWPDSVPLEVTVTSDADKTYEASLMGAGGQEYGVALYEERGAVARIAGLVDAGRMQDAARVRGLSVTFDDDPVWAAQAIGDFCGVPCVPVPIKLSHRGPSLISDARPILELAATLSAVAELAPETLDVERTAGEGKVRVRVRAPEPAGS